MGIAWYNHGDSIRKGMPSPSLCPVLHDLAEWAAGPGSVGAFGRVCGGAAARGSGRDRGAFFPMRRTNGYEWDKPPSRPVIWILVSDSSCALITGRRQTLKKYDLAEDFQQRKPGYVSELVNLRLNIL